MRKSRFSDEQIVAILREADRTSVVDAAKKHKVSEQTLYVWRKHFAGLAPADVKLRKALELENAKLKSLLAERDLEVDLMQQIQRLRHEAARHQGGHAGQVPAPPGEARDEASADRVRNGNHHGRDRRRGILDGPVGLRRRRDDQVRSKPDQFAGEPQQLVGLTSCVAALDDQVLALDVAALTQFLAIGVRRSPPMM